MGFNDIPFKCLLHTRWVDPSVDEDCAAKFFFQHKRLSCSMARTVSYSGAKRKIY